MKKSKCLTPAGLSHFYSLMMTSLNNKFDNLISQDKIVMDSNITESGFCLDAREANPNIENSIAYNVNKLNNMLNAEENLISYLKNNQTDNAISWFSSSAFRLGMHVFLSLNLTFNPTGKYSINLAEIPSVLEPLSSVTMNVITNNGQSAYIYLDSSNLTGMLGVQTDTVITKIDGIRVCIYYLAKNELT